MSRKALILAALSGLASQAGASVISINFTGAGGEDGTLASTDAAGFVSATNWNNIAENGPFNSNTGTSLVDDSGSATSAMISWGNGTDGTGIGSWAIGSLTPDTPDHRMFRGYLDNYEGLRTITLSGLDAGTIYNIYVYSDGDNDSNVRRGFFTMSGTTTELIDAAGNYSGSYEAVPSGTADSGNYTVFTVSGATSYDLMFQGTLADDIPRAPLNGLQIVSVPEPSSIVFGTLTMLTFLRRKRSA